MVGVLMVPAVTHSLQWCHLFNSTNNFLLNLNDLLSLAPSYELADNTMVPHDMLLSRIIDIARQGYGMLSRDSDPFY